MIRLKNQNGSTLLLVVITVAILSMLGTALLSMSLMNVNMKYNDYRVKRTGYYSESAMDQVYAYVGQEVQTSIAGSISQTDIDVASKITYIESILANGAILADGTIDNSKVAERSQYTNEVLDENNVPIPDTYILDTVEIAKYADEQYIKNFRKIMNDHEDDGNAATTFKSVLENASYVNLNAIDPANSTIDIEVGVIDKFTLTSDHEFVIRDVKVIYTDVDNVVKEISSDIVISDEVSAYPLTTLENRYVLSDNPLWQKAIVANGHVNFEGTTAVVNGDIYGYSKIPNSPDLLAATSFDGVKVKGNAGDVTVNGNIYSRGYVQVADGSAELTVNNGIIHANSVVLQSTAPYGRIDVNGNVYTQDDLELNGNNGTIDINGSYFGYTDGSSIGGSSHDKSSAIIINADLVNPDGTATASSISIDGHYDAIGANDIDYYERLEASNLEGILIGGTSYVNFTDRYQTAESVSIKGNYIAYTWAFPSTVIADMIVAGNRIFIDDQYDFFNNEADRNAKVSVVLDETDPSFVWRDVSDVAGLKVTEPATLSDRKLYFASFSEMIDSSNSLIKTGAGQINLQNYIYTTGLQLFNGSFGDDQKLDYTSGGTPAQFGSTQFDALSDKIVRDYIYQMSQLEYRGVSTIADTDTIGGLRYGEAGYDIADLNAVYKYSKIDTLNVNEKYYQPNATNIVGGASDATVVKRLNSTLKPLFILGDGHGQTRSPALDAVNEYIDSDEIVNGVPIGSTLQGVIISNGDIHIYGDIDFAGPIICSGNIIFHDGNVKLHNGSSDIVDYIQALIYDDVDTSLFDMFDVDSYLGYEVNMTTIETVEIVNGSTADATAGNSIFDYRDIVYYKHWKVVR